MSFQFSELTNVELETILGVFDAVNEVGRLLVERHVVENGAAVVHTRLSDAIITEMTRRAHMDAGFRLAARGGEDRDY